MKCDVLIIGGGIVGCATAYYLAREGTSVVVVERGQLNRQASGRNAGSLHFQLEFRLIDHGINHTELFAQVIPLSLLATEHWAQLEKELDTDLGVSLKGGIMIAETDEDLRQLQRKYEVERKWNLPTELLTREEALQMAPYLSKGIVAAGYYPTEGHANPRLVAPAFARRAAEHGAEFVTQTAVREIRRVGKSWVALASRARPDGQTESGELFPIEASAIVNAAGAWSAQIAQMANLHLPLVGVPITMNVTERTAPFVTHLVQNAGRQLSMKQVSEGNLLIGGGWSARFPQRHGKWDLDSSPQLLPGHIRGNLEAATVTVPGVRGLQLIRSWAGTVCVTADQLPILGEMRNAPGFFVATGGAGFTLGPTFARLMSELIRTGSTSTARTGFITSTCS